MSTSTSFSSYISTPCSPRATSSSSWTLQGDREAREGMCQADAMHIPRFLRCLPSSPLAFAARLLQCSPSLLVVSYDAACPRCCPFPSPLAFSAFQLLSRKCTCALVLDGGFGAGVDLSVQRARSRRRCVQSTLGSEEALLQPSHSWNLSRESRGVPWSLVVFARVC